MQASQLPFHQTRLPVLPEQIVRVQASSNYSKIFFANHKPLIVSRVLQWFQDALPADMFLRVHRSHLINKMHVLERSGKGNNVLLLSNGDFITISRRKSYHCKYSIAAKYNSCTN